MLASAAALAATSAGLASLALFAACLGLVMLIVAAGMTVAAAAGGVTVVRTIGPREVQEGAAINLHFTVRGTTSLPVRLEVEDHAGGWVAIEDREASVELRVRSPGPHWLAPSRLRLRDALGIFEWRLHSGRTEPLLILPWPDTLAAFHAHQSGMVGDPEPHGLTPYRPGDPLARIHWPSLARGAGMQVRSFAPSAGGLPLVVVDTAGRPSPQALDWAARRAAGYIVTLARNGGCRVLLPGDASATIVTGVDGEWRATHRRLAMLADRVSSSARPPAGWTQTLYVRAASAPAGLAPSPQLPEGVLVARPAAP
jgi:uncharacterized protein (DUF58 family)